MTILAVAYFREVIGWIDTDAPKGNWKSADTPLARFVENSHPGGLPNTFRFLQPEGWLAGVLSGENYPETGVRFLSNFTIMEEGSYSLDKVGIDTLHARLADCRDEQGVFRGAYRGPASHDFNPAFEATLSNLWKNALMPKFSGAQVKIPVSLLPDENGSQVILPAVNTPFSHILKVPREGFLQSLPTVEWLGLELSKRAGIVTAEHALVEMPNGMAPSLIVERFDIPDVNDDLTRLTRISDFCNITGKPPKDYKYGTDISECFAALEQQSSNPDEDRIALFKRLVLSHYLRDTDMHLKNISVLKTYDRDTGETTVRFAPVYDAMTTVIYPDLSDRESALSFDPHPERGGMDSGPIKTKQDLLKIAALNGIPPEEADEIIGQISQSLVDNAVDIVRNPPEIIKNHSACMHALKCAVSEIMWATDAANEPDWYDYAKPEEYLESLATSTAAQPARLGAAFPAAVLS